MGGEKVKDILDVTQSINGHSFTYQWLLDSLREHDGRFKKLHGTRPVKEIAVKNISDAQGFISYVYQCTLTFADSTDPLDTYSTILKVPTLDTLEQARAEFDQKYENDYGEVHKFECDFYNNFGPILEIPIPKVFKTVDWKYKTQEGCIHMEDLSLRGKGKFFQNATLFGEFIKDTDLFIEAFLKRSKREEAFKPYIEKYRKFSLNRDYTAYANLQAYKDLGMTSVLVHGDIFAGNIMWSLDANGDIQNDIAAIIDWQVMHEGSPMTDLSCFLTFCADGATRRQAEEFAIDFYHHCLSQEFEGEVPYTVEQLQQAYDYAFISHAFITTGMAEFLIRALEKKETNKAKLEAYFDAAALKALHAYEDLDRLLQGKYRHVLEKYARN